ncbi:MAG: hypothetical protein RJB38_1938 [Pseudomonadota bacterium]
MRQKPVKPEVSSRRAEKKPSGASRKKSGLAKAGKTDPRAKLDLDIVYQKVLNALLRIDPRGLNYSKISRFTGVPRPTLYYYFGNRVEGLVEEAARYGMKIFLQIYELDRDRSVTDWQTLQYHRMLRSLRLIRDYPWGPGLYFRYRNDHGPIGQTIRSVEAQYFQDLNLLWKQIHGKAADLDLLKLNGALKLGLFFGFSSESGLKVPTTDEGIDRWARSLSAYLCQAMQLQLSLPSSRG